MCAEGTPRHTLITQIKDRNNSSTSNKAIREVTTPHKAKARYYVKITEHFRKRNQIPEIKKKNAALTKNIQLRD